MAGSPLGPENNTPQALLRGRARDLKEGGSADVRVGSEQVSSKSDT